MRLIVNGKFDTLNRINKDLRSQASTQQLQDLNHIATLAIKKTDGWVSEFLAYYVDNYISNSANKINTFEKHFPELYVIIS
ncbi:hypothetical protein D3C74_333570 [compost metagenome]